MREIIERGYLYIAQPPLYKVSEGRKSQYLKDNAEYRDYLVSRLRDTYRLTLHLPSEANGSEGEQELSGPRLGQLLHQLEAFRERLHRLTSRGYPSDALRIALLEGIHDRRDLEDQEKLDRVAQIIEASGFHEVEIARPEDATPSILFKSRRDGVVRSLVIDRDLVTSVEYRALAHSEAALQAWGAQSFTVAHGEGESEEVIEVPTLDELLETLFSAAKKGVNVQRYKGLGEMNPDQLWETTMDPERRNLLQVRVEDEYSADEIFTTLMGDQVEPRRLFITENALAANLDI
jgi:DNA gyrase subunit B